MIISDSVIEPFIIEVDHLQFTLKKKRKKGETSKNPGEEYLEFIGHYVDLNSALRKIIKTRILNDEVIALNEFINRWEKENRKILTNITL